MRKKDELGKSWLDVLSIVERQDVKEMSHDSERVTIDEDLD
jgi:hypothetical protein